jgi:hypothetical protein
VRPGRSAKRRSAVSPRLPGGRASGSATSTRSSLGTAKGYASDVTAQSRDQKRAGNPPETSSPRRSGGPTLRRLDLRCATFRDSGLSNRCPLRNDLRYGRPGRISQVHAGCKQKSTRVRGVDQPAPPGASRSHGRADGHDDGASPILLKLPLRVCPLLAEPPQLELAPRALVPSGTGLVPTTDRSAGAITVGACFRVDPSVAAAGQAAAMDGATRGRTKRVNTEDWRFG